MTFAAVKSRVQRYLIDLPEGVSSELDGWVNTGIRTAQERHNFRVMEASASFTTTPGIQVLTKPSDWKEMRVNPWLNEDGRTVEIDFAPSESEMIRIFNSDPDIDTGKPRYILETEDELLVYPVPDNLSLNPSGNYIINVPYWKFLPALVQDNDVNFFVSTMFDYCTFYAVAEGMIFNREEERAAVYVNKAEQKFQQAVRLDKRSRLPRRLNLSVHADAYGNTARGRL